MKFIEEELNTLNIYLKESLSDKTNEISDDIYDFIFSKSKKLRPTLIFLFTKALNLKISDEIYNLAVCTELLHNSTLIHDDIIDNADFRREKQSLNKKLGNNLSVLAGDFILSESMLHLTKCKNLECFKIFSNSLKSMCKGEINQHFSLNKIPTMEEYIQKSKNKTAELFNASLVSLCLIEKIQKTKEMSEFAINFGIAFQIKDDLENILQTNNTKPQLSDIYNGIFSAPIIFLQQEFNVEKLKIEEIIHLVTNNEIKQKTLNLIEKYAKKAIASIEFIKDNQYKREIIALCENLYKAV